MRARAIEVSFPVVIDLTEEDQRAIHDAIAAVCDRYKADNPSRVMWPFGIGFKPIYIPMTRDEEEAGRQIEFDEDTFQIEVAERENYDWPCGKCGKPQGDHAGCITDPPAGACVYEPKNPDNAVVFVNGTLHKIPARDRLDYQAIFALAYPGREITPGATVVYHWRGKGDHRRDGTIYGDKTVRPADGMQISVCFTGSA